MRYYVTADPHGYCSLLKAALEEKGFFKDTEPHKLIICGDLFDRGEEAAAMEEFILDLMTKDQVILIRGNHEDLTENLLNYWHLRSYIQMHHHSNGTIDTVCQLTGHAERDLYNDSVSVYRDFRDTPYIRKIIPAMVDFFETDRHIFVHGWIPCIPVSVDCNTMEFHPVPHWRSADKALWDKARWINGMEAAHAGITVPGKTIVCGHWHCSYGHSRYENDGGEFENNPNFSPYYGSGIIALDACTAWSGRVNCIVIED